MAKVVAVFLFAMLLSSPALGQSRGAELKARQLARKELTETEKRSKPILKEGAAILGQPQPDGDYLPKPQFNDAQKKLLEKSQAEWLRLVGEKKGKLKELATELSGGFADLKRASVSSGVLRESADSSAKNLATYENELVSLKELLANSPRYILEMPQKEPKDGDVGSLGELIVASKLNDREAVVTRKWVTSVVTYQSIDGQADASSMIPRTRFHQHEAEFWMTGDFTSLADGSKFTPKAPYMVSGTKTFETAVGSSRTIFRLEPLELP